MKPKILYLTLSKLPFDTMKKGLKDREYRSPSKWIRSRLVDKNGNPKRYDYVRFASGYHRNAPYFMCKFNGFEISKKNYKVEYSTRLIVNVYKGDYRILLGSIITKGNTEMKELFEKKLI